MIAAVSVGLNSALVSSHLVGTGQLGDLAAGRFLLSVCQGSDETSACHAPAKGQLVEKNRKR